MMLTDGAFGRFGCWRGSHRTLALGVLVTYLAWSVGAVVAGEQPDSAAKVMRVSATVDFAVTGDGSTAAWDKALWVPICKRDGGNHDYTTRVKMLYSPTGVYALMDRYRRPAECDHDRGFPQSVDRGYFLRCSCGLTSAIPVYFEYEISPLGYELPILIPNFEGKFLGWRPWRYDGERRTRKATAILGGPKESGAKISGWRAEVFIPYELLTPLQNVPPKPGARWRANFYRVDYDGGKRTAWDWARVGTTFHEYQKFGTLVFE